MGSSVRAKCQCGFNKSFSLGGGMDNHLTFCAFPCYCYDCKSLYTDNLYNDKLECDNCHSNKCSPFDEQKFHGFTAKIMQPIITYKQLSFLGKILGHKLQEIIYFIIYSMSDSTTNHYSYYAFNCRFLRHCTPLAMIDKIIHIHSYT